MTPRAGAREEAKHPGDEVWEAILHGIAGRYGETPAGIATGLANLPESSAMPILRLVAARYGNHVTTQVIAAFASQKAGVTPEAAPGKVEAQARRAAEHPNAEVDPVLQKLRAGVSTPPSASETWSEGLRGASTGDITQSPHPLIQVGARPAAEGATAVVQGIAHAVSHPRETWRHISESLAKSYDDGGGGLIGVLYAIGEHNPVAAAGDQISELLDAVSDRDYKRAAKILGAIGMGVAAAWGFSRLLGRFVKRRGGAASGAASEEAVAEATAPNTPEEAVAPKTAPKTPEEVVAPKTAKAQAVAPPEPLPDGREVPEAPKATAAEAETVGSTTGRVPVVVNESTMLGSAAEPYKGTTRLGHAFQKHADRFPGKWGKVTGAADTYHAQGLRHLNEITNGPGSFEAVTYPDKGLSWIEKRLPDGRGVRLNRDHTFKGFID